MFCAGKRACRGQNSLADDDWRAGYNGAHTSQFVHRLDACEAGWAQVVQDRAIQLARFRPIPIMAVRRHATSLSEHLWSTPDIQETPPWTPSGTCSSDCSRFQNGLINQAQLVAAFQAWSLDKAQSLADCLVARRDLNAAQRAAIEVLAALHMDKHGGDAKKSLAAIPAALPPARALPRLAIPTSAGR